MSITSLATFAHGGCNDHSNRSLPAPGRDYPRQCEGYVREICAKLSRRPRLVRKYYLYGDDRTGGGVYLWNSREAAERFYSEAWKSTIAQRYGTQPEISFYDTSVIVENVDQKASAA